VRAIADDEVFVARVLMELDDFDTAWVFLTHQAVGEAFGGVGFTDAWRPLQNEIPPVRE
jgi:hypothetical protein